MSRSATAADDVEVEDPPKRNPKRETRQETRSKSKRQPPYAVILHNDNLNGMDYVIGVLRKVFGYGRTKCIWLMLKTHRSGQTQVWSGAFEVAELKADQLRSCGADPGMKRHGARALNVSLEPLE